MTQKTRSTSVFKPLIRAWIYVSHLARILWQVVDHTRRTVINLLFLALVTAAAVMVFWGRGDEIAAETAVVLAPRGTLVEELTGGPLSALGSAAGDDSENETLLRDVLDTIRAAKDDERVRVLVLDLGKLRNTGLSKLQEVAEAVRVFSETDKLVIATADNYSQAAYYLAAHADEIYLHPMGQLTLEGFGRYRMYFKEALDRLEVEANIFRVGTFKSAVEPFMATGMSDAAREANLEWMGDLWRAYLEDVSLARGVSMASVRDYAESFDTHLRAANGDAATAAVSAGLIDGALTRDQVRDRLVELVGEHDKHHSFHQVAGSAYLARQRRQLPSKPTSGDAVGVIVARGAIVNGRQPPGMIGGDSTAELVRRARHNEDIKAIVLRVDSGGGSAFASEVIRRELELTRDAGKPVVVSMGSVAASGGYWIACASDEIWASPTTITGSIGIFGMFPTFERPLANLGIRVDGISMTTMGAARLDRSLDPKVAAVMQDGIERGYQRFVQTVASARDMDVGAVDEVAQGRVWSGVDAHERGLVDHLGGLDDAIAAAARLAELPEAHRVEFIERERSLQDRVIGSFTKAMLSTVSETVGPVAGLGTGQGAFGYARVLQTMAKLASELAILSDPHGVYAYALLDVD